MLSAFASPLGELAVYVFNVRVCVGLRAAVWVYAAVGTC